MAVGRVGAGECAPAAGSQEPTALEPREREIPLFGSLDIEASRASSGHPIQANNFLSGVIDRQTGTFPCHLDLPGHVYMVFLFLLSC